MSTNRHGLEVILDNERAKKRHSNRAPVAAMDARNRIRTMFSELAAVNNYDTDQDAILHRQNLMGQLQNIDQSIVTSGLRHLPKDAARILDEVVGESARACAVDAEIIGGFDISANQRRMNELREIPITVAYALLRGGLKVIDNAIQAAKQPWYKPDLPGETARKLVADKLKWHADALSKVTPAETFYRSGEDLKKWVMQAFIEANAVEEGAAYINNAWDQMWSEIVENVRQLPAAVVSKVGDIARGTLSMAVEGIFGVPAWVVGVAAAGIAGLAAYWYLAPRRR